MPRGKSAASLALIDAAWEILSEIQPATVRAVCYRLFVQRLIASMEKTHTNRVSAQLTWARLQGKIPWAWIVDETRTPEYAPTWENPERLIRATIRQYRKDRWVNQPRQVEVWSEKGTVRGTLAPVLDEYGVTFRVMHGYGSTTAVHDAACQSSRLRVPLLVLYAGDWDPSGIHMSEVDLPARLEKHDAHIEIRRVALSSADVTYGELPSFPAATKQKDPRYGWFVRHHGDTCWELDALSPTILRDTVRSHIVGLIDVDQWERDGRTEALEQESMREILGSWKAAAG